MTPASKPTSQEADVHTRHSREDGRPGGVPVMHRRATNAELRARPRRRRPRVHYPLKSSREGWVYFIQAVNGGPIKIGSARTVATRLEEIGRLSPFRLRLVAAASGGRFTELNLHSELHDYRLHGEWFDPSAPFLQTILERCDG